MEKIAIVGGGIIGLTLASYLDPKKFELTLFDDGAGQATKASAGIISPWLSKRRNQRWYHLAKDGAAFFPKLIQDFQLDETIYQQCGTLLLQPAETLSELASLAEKRRLTAPEIGTIQLLDAETVAKKNPLLAPRPALFISGGGRLDGKRYLAQLKKQLQEKINFVTGCIQLKSETALVFAGQELEFDQIILTPGPQLKNLLKDVGYTVDIRPQKGQLLVFETELIESGNWPVAMLSGEADLIPFEKGKILLGATHENDATWDLAETAAAFTQLTESARPYLATPAKLLATPVHYRVGTRAYTSDFAPFFGRLSDTLVVASGLGSSGLTTGPLIGYLLAQSLNYRQTLDYPNYQKPLTRYIQARA